MHSQQLFGSTGLVALEAYRGIAKEEGLPIVPVQTILDQVNSKRPDRTAEAFTTILSMAETLAKAAAALVETAQRMHNLDSFEWSACGEDNGRKLYDRYHKLTLVSQQVENWIS